MSKGLQATVYVDERVGSVSEARRFAEKAEKARKELKSELWGLIMATPKDITAHGEDPITNVRERFEDIWDSLWDAFVDDYKYTIIADDAEFCADSLVQKYWEEEKRSLDELRKQEEKREAFFKKHCDVLSVYNFDDYKIYDEWRLGNIEIPQPFTTEDRKRILSELKAKEDELIQEAMKKFKEKNNEE